jgi:phosphatidylserine/phosphatidylglycerophosphate/cardiolipin synthase-like enzyme
MTTHPSWPFVATGSYPTRGGNLVQPLIDGEPAFHRICEAIEAARHSVWATITFMWPAFRMPGERGTALEVLDRAASRGVDVRVIFWRPDAETEALKRDAFWGAPEHLELLRRNNHQVRIRWDRAHPDFCQHQKTWLIDAGKEAETSFVGGINLNPHSLVSPGHRGGHLGEGQNHDVYIELAGPSVADVHHNFVQRWNESSERHLDDGRWGAGSETDLPFPHRVPAERGTARVQIQRTTHPGRYTDGQAPPEGHGFDIKSGERTNFDQYCSAICAARRTIYMENQDVEVADIVAELHGALKRGVEIVLLVPAIPDISPTAYETVERRAFFEARAALGKYDNFTLAGIAGLGSDGLRKPVYVHSKLMLIDDAWATVGSCNLHRSSLFGNGELNAAFSDPEIVRAFRVAFFQEHLAQDTSALDDRAALALFRRIARENKQRHQNSDPVWQGLAISLDVATYGKAVQF